MMTVVDTVVAKLSAQLDAIELVYLAAREMELISIGATPETIEDLLDEVYRDAFAAGRDEVLRVARSVWLRSEPDFSSVQRF
jgi:hypothetical protein